MFLLSPKGLQCTLDKVSRLSWSRWFQCKCRGGYSSSNCCSVCFCSPLQISAAAEGSPSMLSNPEGHTAAAALVAQPSLSNSHLTVSDFCVARCNFTITTSGFPFFIFLITPWFPYWKFCLEFKSALFLCSWSLQPPMASCLSYLAGLTAWVELLQFMQSPTGWKRMTKRVFGSLHLDHFANTSHPVRLYLSKFSLLMRKVWSKFLPLSVLLS